MTLYIENASFEESWNNDIKPVLRTLTSSELKALEPTIAALPDSMRSSAEKTLSSAIASAVKREESIETQRGKDGLQAQMDERAKELDKLWKEFESKEFQDKLSKYADEDKKSLERIDALLADPSKMTEEEKRKARGDYTNKEKEELEEKRRLRNTIVNIYKEASEQAHYHGFMAEKTTGEERKHHEAEQAKQIARVKEITPAYEKKAKRFEELKEKVEKAGENTAVVKDKVRDHFKENKKEYYEEIKNHKNLVEAKIVKLLAKAGLDKELSEIQKELGVDLTKAVKEAEKEAAKQKAKLEEDVNSPSANDRIPPRAVMAEVLESNVVTAPNTPNRSKFKNSSQEQTR